ncbi:MAG: hypothetical protein V3V10_08625, partial [Planctomycetota bacterium]
EAGVKEQAETLHFLLCYKAKQRAERLRPLREQAKKAAVEQRLKHASFKTMNFNKMVDSPSFKKPTDGNL